MGKFAGVDAWNLPHERVSVGRRHLKRCRRNPYLCDHKVNTWNRCFNLSVHLLHSDVDASCFEGEVRLYFVLPIKMKWMLVFELLYLAYIVFNTFKTMIAYANGTWLGWVLGLVQSSQIILAVANMFLFFWASKTHISRKQKKRQREFRAQFSNPRPGSGISQHKCVICGRTELTNPELQFRYCSKCTGNKEYCQDHLFTHTHM